MACLMREKPPFLISKVLSADVQCLIDAVAYTAYLQHKHVTSLITECIHTLVFEHPLLLAFLLFFIHFHPLCSHLYLRGFLFPRVTWFTFLLAVRECIFPVLDPLAYIIHFIAIK